MAVTVVCHTPKRAFKDARALCGLAPRRETSESAATDSRTSEVCEASLGASVDPSCVGLRSSKNTQGFRLESTPLRFAEHYSVVFSLALVGLPLRNWHACG